MTSWTTLTNTALGAYKILRAATMQALYDNPQAIAERAANAPVVQVPVIEVKTSGTGATWTWPAGVTAATFYLQAGGGGGGSTTNTGTDGGDTSITYNSITTTAEGGDGGTFTGGTFTPGGNAGGGDLSIYGNTAIDANGASSHLGQGGPSGITPRYGAGGYGAGSGAMGGGGGEFVRKRVVKVDGLNTVTYTVGPGGAAGAGSGGQAGAAGVIIIEY